MDFPVRGLSFWILFAALSTTSARFMEGFHQDMQQFHQQMQEFGNNMQRNFGNIGVPQNFMSGFQNDMENFNRQMQNVFGGSNNNSPGFGSAPDWIKNVANPQIPVFPENFPWPKNCKEISDVPGLEYPNPEEGVNVQFSNGVVNKTIKKQTFECTDDRYPQPFYMLKSIVHYSAEGSGNQSDSSFGKVKYYDQDKNEISYQPEVQTRPLWN